MFDLSIITTSDPLNLHVVKLAERLNELGLNHAIHIELIIADDLALPKETLKKCTDYGCNRLSVVTITSQQPMGQERAAVNAFQQSHASTCIFMNPDQHPVLDDFENLFRLCQQHPIIHSVRLKRDQGILRRFGSWAINRYLSRRFHLDIADLTSPLFAINGEATQQAHDWCQSRQTSRYKLYQAHRTSIYCYSIDDVDHNDPSHYTLYSLLKSAWQILSQR